MEKSSFVFQTINFIETQSQETDNLVPIFRLSLIAKRCAGVEFEETDFLSFRFLWL